MTISQLRKIINSRFRTDADFTAFCIDFFPDVANRFSTGLERLEKINLLLQIEDADNIYEKLKTGHITRLPSLNKSSFGFLFAISCAFVIALLVSSVAVKLTTEFLRSRAKPDSKAEQLYSSPTILANEGMAISASGKVLSESHKTGQTSRTTNKKNSSVSDNKNGHVSSDKRGHDGVADNNFIIRNTGPTQINNIRGHHGSISIMQSVE